MITNEMLEDVIVIMGEDGISDEDLENRVLELCGERMLARRFIDCLPEAFGLVFVPHLANVNLPSTFSAKDRRGKWMEFEFAMEPIFLEAMRLGAELYHAGPRKTFSNIVQRSAIVEVVNKALNDGSSLEGATLSGPALIGIPAETYLQQQKSRWQRRFWWLFNG